MNKKELNEYKMDCIYSLVELPLFNKIKGFELLKLIIVSMLFLGAFTDLYSSDMPLRFTILLSIVYISFYVSIFTPLVLQYKSRKVPIEEIIESSELKNFIKENNLTDESYKTLIYNFYKKLLNK